jgi:uncharacterized protein YdaU (DUF1376 family)
MAKQRPPAFQFYAKEFLAGTTNMRMAAVGAYIRFLAHAWDGNPICSIPADDYSLFKLSGADSKEEWNEVKDQVLAKWEPREIDGQKRLVNLRLLAYFKELAEHHKEMSDRGKKGAEARWDKDGGKGFDPEEA